jgi:hypothetical protein
VVDKICQAFSSSPLFLKRRQALEFLSFSPWCGKRETYEQWLGNLSAIGDGK